MATNQAVVNTALEKRIKETGVTSFSPSSSPGTLISKAERKVTMRVSPMLFSLSGD
jgi:hypothetical protein